MTEGRDEAGFLDRSKRGIRGLPGNCRQMRRASRCFRFRLGARRYTGARSGAAQDGFAARQGKELYLNKGCVGCPISKKISAGSAQLGSLSPSTAGENSK